MDNEQVTKVALPDINSNDFEERIAARRLRVAKAEERSMMTEDHDSEEAEEKKELYKSIQQIELVRQRLKKLESEGTQLVSNIRVAGDARESERRAKYEECTRIRNERIEQEAKMSAGRLEEINKKWELTLQKDIPQSLHESLLQQKLACDALLDEKNKLINDFQQELKTFDDRYVKDLKKQADDVDLFVERMEEQLKTQSKSMRDELERAFLVERDETRKLHKKKWEQELDNRRMKEREYLDARQKLVNDYEEQIRQVRLKGAEEYQRVKIKLETEVQNLEQLLEQLRATCQLNQEKLEYNFQVLKKRDDENMMIKSKQKRKITRLQDILNNLKEKLAKQDKQYSKENNQLTDDCKRLTEQFKDVEKRAKHFMTIDLQKFNDLWCMNEEICKKLLSRVIASQEIIMEQLGVDWKSPDLSFMENKGPLKFGLITRQLSAHQVINEVIQLTSSYSSKENEEKKYTSVSEKVTPVTSSGTNNDHHSLGQNRKLSSEISKILGKDESSNQQMVEMIKSGIFSKISINTIKGIMELICDESEFLIESKLNTLLLNLDKDEQMLMKLDNVFSALNVTKESDILQLATFFMLSVETITPALEQRSPSYLNVNSEVIGKSADAGIEVVGRENINSETGTNFDAETEMEEEKDVHKQLTFDAAKDDVILIHPNNVLKALRDFLEKYKRTDTKNKNKLSQFHLSTGDTRNSSGDAAYWKRYQQTVTNKQKRLWDAILDDLLKYRNVLTERSQLIKDNSGLRQQNQELNMLLHQYVNAKVNTELQIPPTRILQLNLNNPNIEQDKFVFK